MKKEHLQINKALMVLLGVALTLASCSKDEEIAPNPDPVSQTPKAVIGVYSLDEGAYSTDYQPLGSTITFYNKITGETISDFYEQVNGKKLGVNANDLKNYGTKLYGVVTGTDGSQNSYVEVMDATTGKSIKRINFFEGETSFMPRFITFSGSKAYVSNYDGKICRIDTADLNIEARIALDKGLEDIAVANGKLYVANSIHPYYAGKGNVVSVVDINTFTKVRDIQVAINPVKLTVTPGGDVLVMSRGTYDENWNFLNNAAVTRINTITDVRVSEQKYNNGEVVYTIATANGLAYAYSDSFFKHVSLSDGTLGSNFITDGTTIGSIYGLNIDGLSNDVYVAESSSTTEGKIFGFDKAGNKKLEFVTGAYPKTVAFRYAYQ